MDGHLGKILSRLGEIGRAGLSVPGSARAPALARFGNGGEKGEAWDDRF
jgi:hypothetical protein